MTWRAWQAFDAARLSPYRGTVFYLPSFGLFTVDRSDVYDRMTYDANGRSADWDLLLRDGEILSLPLYLVEQEADRTVEARRREIRALESQVYGLEDEVTSLRGTVATLEAEIARLRS